jgi:hypothetical protein
MTIKAKSLVNGVTVVSSLGKVPGLTTKRDTFEDLTGAVFFISTISVSKKALQKQTYEMQIFA